MHATPVNPKREPGATRAARLAGELLVPLVFLPSFVQGFQGEAGLTLTESRPRDRGHAVDKLGLEQDVGVGEHAILEGHHHKLQGGGVTREKLKASGGSVLHSKI